ncbi:MAG: hypothetical protein ABJ171_09540 [Halieaceae bacterium]
MSLLLASPGIYAADDEAAGRTETAAEQAGFTRFLDREYLIDSGFDLPAQWGLSAYLSHTESKLPIENLKYGFSEDEPLSSSPFVTMDDMDNTITNSGIILDYWILPMVDIYAILGHTDGEMDTNVNTFGSSQPLGFNFTGTTYGIGGTLVTGYKQVVLIFDYNYMELDTDVYEDIIPVSNRTLRLGWNFAQSTWLPEVAWLSYIDTEFEGTFDLKQIVGEGVDPGTVPPGTEAVLLSFEVEPYDTWAIGAQWKLSESFQLVSEIGLDTVKGVTLALNYRWE